MQCLPQALSNKSSPADFQSKARDKPVLHKSRCSLPIKLRKCLCSVRQVITVTSLYIAKYQLRKCLLKTNTGFKKVRGTFWL